MNDTNNVKQNEFIFNDQVSVIIPTFNRRNTLARAVNSALKQTYSIREVLICDDGSEDDSKQIITSFNDSRIKWIDCGKNGMPSIPRNIGIRAATGAWIAFLDSDDEWLSHKIEKQVNLLIQTQGLAVSSNAFRIVNGENKGIYLSNKKKVITFSDLLAVNGNICSSVLINKNLLLKISLFPEEQCLKAIEDYSLWLRIATQTPFAYINEPLLNYYDSPKTSIRSSFTKEGELRKTVFNFFVEWMKQQNVRLAPQDAIRLADTYKKVFANRGMSIRKLFVSLFMK